MSVPLEAIQKRKAEGDVSITDDVINRVKSFADRGSAANFPFPRNSGVFFVGEALQAIVLRHPKGCRSHA